MLIVSAIWKIKISVFILLAASVLIIYVIISNSLLKTNKFSAS